MNNSLKILSLLIMILLVPAIVLAGNSASLSLDANPGAIGYGHISNQTTVTLDNPSGTYFANSYEGVQATLIVPNGLTITTTNPVMIGDVTGNAVTSVFPQWTVQGDQAQPGNYQVYVNFTDVNGTLIGSTTEQFGGMAALTETIVVDGVPKVSNIVSALATEIAYATIPFIAEGNVTNTGTASDANFSVVFKYESDKMSLDNVQLCDPTCQNITITNGTDNGFVTATHVFPNTLNVNGLITYKYSLTAPSASTLSQIPQVRFKAKNSEVTTTIQVNSAISNALSIHRLYDSTSGQLDLTLTNENLVIPVTILNTGTVTEQNILVKLLVDGVEVAQQSISSLASLGDSVINFANIFTDSKIYNVTATTENSNVASVSKSRLFNLFVDVDSDGVSDDTETLIGRMSDINTNGTFTVGLEVNGAPLNTSNIYTGSLLVNFKEALQSRVSFTHNFTNKLDLRNVVIKVQNTIDGGILVKGLSGKTKTVYIDDINPNKNYVCVKNQEVDEITQISSDCNGNNENKIECDGSLQVGHTCTLEGNYYKVTGLTNSAVVETADPVVEQQSTGGGGGGGSRTSRLSSQNSGGVTIFKWTKIRKNEVITSKFLNPELSVTALQFTTRVDLRNAEFTISKVEADSPYSNGKVFEYVEFDTKNVEQLDSILIDFRVPVKWLKDNGFDESSIKLARFSNNVWQELSTQKISETATHLNFVAGTPGFSTFAIVAKEVPKIKSEKEIKEVPQPVQEEKELVIPIELEEQTGMEGITGAAAGGSFTARHPGLVIIVFVVLLVLLVLSFVYRYMNFKK